ncbi:SDR family NAD(P)-dependent oxidoreductase [Spirosoma luteum]|uniref:SDR family NAD(P)-dependent oxidoreductase n=1 Tax=Spirosoma luteum TaxID=431553 RepID=UPI000A0322C5
MLEVNITSQFLGTRAVAGNIIANGGGSIINMSSTAGFIATSAHPSGLYSIQGRVETTDQSCCQ